MDLDQRMLPEEVSTLSLCCHGSHSLAFVLCRISFCQVNLLSLSLKSHSLPSVLSRVLSTGA